jgi:SNF2 family DNA or RNA helicase
LLARKRKDSDKAKAFDESALDAKLAQLDPVPDFVTAPRKHQKVGFLLGATYPAYLMFFDMGLGKSWLMLNLFKWRKQRGEAPKALLVLVPLESLVIGWQEQVETHTPSLTYAGVAGSSGQREAALSFNAGVVVMTYATFLRLVTVEVPVVDDGEHQRTKGGRPKVKWVVDHTKVVDVMGAFSGLVVDECTAIKNHQSQTYKAVKSAGECVLFRYGLAGRPLGRDPEALWSQFKAIDHGESLGETLGLFRSAFFKPKRNYWSGGFDWVLDKSKEHLLRRCTRHRSITYAENECADLPPLVRVVRKVKWARENREYHERLIDEMRESKGAFRLVENVFLRMRQLSSGYLGVVDPEGERVQIKFKDNPKMDELVAVLNEVPLDRKAIVFNDYTITGDLICERLKTEKIKHVRLFGGTRDKAGVLDKFKRDPKARVLVLQSAAGSFGLNLQVANYCIFYESPVDPIIRAQAEKRAHRTGQTETVFIIDLVVRQSVDERVLKFIKEGNNLFEAVLRQASTLWA